MFTAARGPALLRGAGRVVVAAGVTGSGGYCLVQAAAAAPSPAAVVRLEESAAAAVSNTAPERSRTNELARHPTRAAAAAAAAHDLVVPTLEAAGRAARLVATAARIAADYQLANWVPDSAVDEEARYWEQEVARRQAALDEAQTRYSRRTHPELDDVARFQAKAHEKRAMQAAAEALSEAEEQLALHPSRQSRLHRLAAHRLRELCHANGGVYIKVGQHLANLDYLIPREYIEVLSALFDDNPRTDYELVCRILREDLKADPSELFDRFDPEPVASASLAQVHVAYERGTGRKLAVKVQHHGLRETSAGDLFALVTVVRLAERLFAGFSWGWLADEIAPQLPKELDFANEGRNAERAAVNLRKVGGLRCVVPKILWQYSSPRVLTMEFEEGFKATDVAAIRRVGLRERDVAQLIAAVFSSQVFLSGWVHCDPHPANVLLRARRGKPEIVLLDHGLYRELDPEFRLRYSYLWRSLMLADLSGIEKACQGLGVHKAYPLFAAMLTARPFDEIIERSETGALHHGARVGDRADKAVIRNYAQRYLGEIFQLLGSLPRQVLLLLKMNDCLRHIDHSLGSPANTLVVSGTYAARAVCEGRFRDRGSSWIGRWAAWWDYLHVMLRVSLHDAAVWWAAHAPDVLRLRISY